MAKQQEPLHKVKIVVDTNIIFSAILNSNSTIGQIILTSEKHFQFYSCEYLKIELLHHRNKLLKLTGLTGEVLDELELSIIKNIIYKRKPNTRRSFDNK